MAEHSVVITMSENGDLVPTTGRPPRSAHTVTAHTGDTIRWDSPDGPVTINFPDASPFGGKGEVKGSQAHTVTGDRGTYKYECGVMVNGKVIGWPGKSSANSGGEVKIVRRN
jgi:plastocyanin